MKLADVAECHSWYLYQACCSVWSMLYSMSGCTHSMQRQYPKGWLFLKHVVRVAGTLCYFFGVASSSNGHPALWASSPPVMIVFSCREALSSSSEWHLTCLFTSSLSPSPINICSCILSLSLSCTYQHMFMFSLSSSTYQHMFTFSWKCVYVLWLCSFRQLVIYKCLSSCCETTKHINENPVKATYGQNSLLLSALSK